MRNSAAYFAGASIIKIKKNILKFAPVFLVFSISIKIKKNIFQL
jgi:hypothetical protein